jgi:hypothetical protein
MRKTNTKMQEKASTLSTEAVSTLNTMLGVLISRAAGVAAKGGLVPAEPYKHG